MKNKLNIKTIDFITGVTSPFWYEFFNLVSEKMTVSIRVIETSCSLEGRQEHWKDIVKKENRVRQVNRGKSTAIEKYLKETIDEMASDITLFGGFSVDYIKMAKKIKKKFPAKKTIFVAEKPNKDRVKIIYYIKKLYYRVKIWYAKPDALLAIGENAKKYYEEVAGDGTVVILFPYIQDNAKFTRLVLRNNNCLPKKGLTILFCGQMIKRNNPELLAKILIALNKRNSVNYSFIISGSGPLLSKFKSQLCSGGIKENKVEYYNEFNSWEERMSPYIKSDILLLPSSYSGWGLVVPEALSVGNIVISTSKVEAVGYYIKDFYNGFVFNDKVDEYVDCIEFLLNNPDIVEEMKVNCIESSKLGNIEHGYKIFSRLLRALDEKNKSMQIK